MPIDHMIIHTDNIQKIQQTLAKAPLQSIVLLDVDDTLITPLSHSCRGTMNLIDTMKQEFASDPAFPAILSQWRLQRKVVLIDNMWVEIINDLKKQHAVYALTQMHIGPFGAIENLQEWRRRELKSLSIHFTTHFNQQTAYLLRDETANEPREGAFHHGLFLTGSLTKAEVVTDILTKQLQPICFVDDRVDHVENVGKVCQEFKVAYIGIVYTQANAQKETVNPRIMALQRQHLLDHQQWLEDDAAKAMLEEQTNYY